MSETKAKYSFLSFVRKGLGNRIAEVDTLAGSSTSSTVLERPEINVEVKLEASAGSTKQEADVSKNVKIQGPGDVLGIQPNQILRVHPAKGVDNFEINNLAYIEFYEEDFPWRFTPAKPNDNHLRPWIALLVLENHEFERNTAGGTPTPFIRINNNALQDVLYPENELHHFAHVHSFQTLSDGINITADQASTLREVVEADSDLALSRLICPRRLNPEKEYHVFLVPAYETGRLAGLGEPTENVVAQKPSWKSSQPGNSSLVMPYYYTWSFKTSLTGNFNELVSVLEVRQAGENTGRQMDLSDPGYGLKPEGNDALGLMEGAIKSPNHVTPNWPVNQQDLKEKLKDLLNLNQTLQTEPSPQISGDFYSDNPGVDPIITPPVYGRWHAMVDTLTNKTDWVHQLNLHPSHRAAAGLGTRVVQEHQEEFMEIAWNQIGPINEVNQKIIENEAAKRASEMLYRKNLQNMDDLTLLNTLGNAMEVLKVGTNTSAKKRLADSRVPTGLRTGAFIKIANNFTQTALMTPNGMDGVTKVLNSNLLTRSDYEENSISPNPKRKSFAIEVNAGAVMAAIAQVINEPPRSFLGNLATTIALTHPKTINLENVTPYFPEDFSEGQLNRSRAIIENIVNESVNDGVLILRIKKEVFESRINNGFDSGEYDVYNGPINAISKVRFVKKTNPVVLFNYNDLLESRVEFSGEFTTAFQNRSSFFRERRAELKSNQFKTDILQKTRPKSTFLRKLKSVVSAPNIDKGKPLMEYPRFPIPVYDFLKEISPDYIIPNVSSIPPNSIALMKPNDTFVEAFLAGMNHEFSRELLWREFPTDMRGSYFRHFWEYDNDPTKYLLPQDGETEEDFNERVIEFQDGAVDVKKLHQWNNQLGGNHQRQIGLFLLIKGELFKKYPDTMVYAQRASSAPVNQPRGLTNFNNPNNVKWPIITGMIEPDLYFFGFNLTPTQAKGNPGWFFVLRERPGQISFGLNDNIQQPLTKPQTWDGLTWNHLTGAETPKYLEIGSLQSNYHPHNNQGITWGASSASNAYILYQSPVLFAKHASVFL